MTIGTLSVYFEALERLKKGRPHFVDKGTKITNDAVSLEAGRKKGSIKKSRRQFEDLIAAIDVAAAEQAQPQEEHAARMHRAKRTVEALQQQLEESIARELSLLTELFEAKKQLEKLTGAKILPIRKSKTR